MVDRFRSWGDRFGIVALMALAAITRLWNLGYPNKLVFDETYYVKDAYTLWRFGHELAWKSGNSDTFSLNGFTNTPEFVVHAPLGKWIIGFGMQVFGAENPVGWRIMPALAGIAAVWLIYLIAKLLFSSKRWALVPAFLLTIDGQAIVVSRTAILDGLVACFVLAGFYLLLRALRSEEPNRWLLWMTVLLGFGAGVKWTSAIFLAIFLAFYAFSKRNWRVLLLGPVAAIPYLLTWTGWFVSRGWGYRSNAVLESFLGYQQQMYHFHSTLYSYHPYQASSATWLLMLRPTSFFYEGTSDVASAITPIGNPVLWFGGIFALALTFAWFARNRDQLSVLIFTGYLAGYLPWLIYSGRTEFQFYSVVFEPWIALMITLACYRYRATKLVVRTSLGAFAFFLFFLPLYWGTEIPLWFWRIHMWLPTWI